ncbi:MAG: LysE family translocator [Alphaproteobacteria bacterium]|nr:LysE family translocator [Alphaproteobacteria bacterium]
MSASLLAACVFAFVASITPGPNNVMLAASGATFGFRRTVPHVLGVFLGFMALQAAVALGLGQVFAASATLQTALKWVGAAYLLWLAWKIGTAGRPAADPDARPLSFLQAAAFQVANPKGWTFAIGVAAIAVDGTTSPAQALAVAALVATIGLPCMAVWAGCGVAVGRWLTSDRALRAFNAAMGIACAASAATIFL